MNTGILLSGGKGTRINTEVPKQYVRVNGHMIVTYSLEAIMKSAYIDCVRIVAEEEWQEKIVKDAGMMGLDEERISGFSMPGKNRQGSIYNAIKDILDIADVNGGADKDDTVLIHDAARPLLTTALIDRCYDALPGHDGVMPVLPMKDTVYLSEDGDRISGLLDRSKVYAGQAPELFKIKPYYEANKALLPDRINTVNGASEPAVMYGMDIALVAGDEGNYKITTDADMERFRVGCGM